MAQTTLEISTDKTLKKEFESLCEEFGMSATTAFNIFTRAVVREGKFPFEILLEFIREDVKKGISTNA